MKRRGDVGKQLAYSTVLGQRSTEWDVVRLSRGRLGCWKQNKVSVQRLC